MKIILMRYYALLLFSVMLLFNSCIKEFGYDDYKGSIKEFGTNSPIKNQKFTFRYSTNKSSDIYTSSTDDNGNYIVKNVLYRDVGQYTFSFKSFEYNARVNSNLYYYFDFYVKEGILQSKCDLKVSFKNSTSINDTLILLSDSKPFPFNKKLSKRLIGPFQMNFIIPILDTVENFCTHKNDGIIERKVFWKFKGQSGTINLTDNYLTGIGTIDSLNF
jgi:hypothetical protein